MVNVMMKIKYVFLFFCIVLFTNCNASQVGQRYVNNIGKYLDMEIKLSKDTVSYGDEITLTVIFKNKSDSSVSFYPHALLLIDKYREYIIFDHIQGRILTKPPFFEALIRLPPRSQHEEIFILNVDDFELFSQVLIVTYNCARRNDKNKKNHLNEKVLFGRLSSQPFKIHIRDD